MSKSKQKPPGSDTPVANVQQLLSFIDDKPKHLLVHNNDIGAELLAILSKGLYTNPLDCLREYVQNGVDAGAQMIRIKITGNSVVVYDEGTGMDMENLVEARKFGVSSKRLEEHVGFRGIGIYSGYDLCNRLIIRTKKEGDDKVNIMRFDFGNMKKMLEDVRKAGGGNQIPLNDLLTAHTSFAQETAEDSKKHFTFVQLEEISEDHIYRLRDRKELREYILQNLPVDFNEKFEYRTVINTQLTRFVPKFRAVKIVLQSDDAKDEVVAKPSIANLQHPTFGAIQTSNKDTVAYYWACLNALPGRIDNETNSPDVGKTKKRRTEANKNDDGTSTEPFTDVSDYQGFVYKTKGFTIGNREKLIPYRTAGAGTLYRWYTGEIYVLDNKVVPNAGRDDFETSPAKAALETAVSAKLLELIRVANKFQQETSANQKIDRIIAEFKDLESKLKSTIPSDAFIKLSQIISEINKQKGKASSEKKDAAQVVLTRAEKLHKEIRKEIDRIDRHRDSATSTKTSRATSTSTASTGSSSSTESGDGHAPTKAYQSLTQVLENYAPSDVNEFQRIIEIVDSALLDVVGKSDKYYLILNNIEEQLQTEYSE
jgi:guanyl-specific ribonuclease Sa